ncbi:MAG: hypothetical protein M3162_03005, partial [Thermoproteota archaeon]|nr:hypothetical protein [Thermoproteota archaeon]
MRLPIRDEKEKNANAVVLLNKIHAELKQKFEQAIKKHLDSVNLKVMLGDFTITETNTFDPQKTIDYFFSMEKEIKNNLKDWVTVSVQSTKTDDKHRVFFQISKEIGKYYFYIYVGIQFHSLLYYKIDKEVININKRIIELGDKNTSIQDEIVKKGDNLIKKELEDLGYKNIDDTALFEELFTKQDLSEKLVQKANKIESNFPEVEKNLATIESLKNELENYIMEVYQINPQTSLDYNK